MKIAKNTVVTLSMSVTDAQNNFIEETSGEGFTYLHGATMTFSQKSKRHSKAKILAMKPPFSSNRTTHLANTMPNSCAWKTVHCSLPKPNRA